MTRPDQITISGVDLFTRAVSTTFPPQVYQPSTVARDQGIQYFSSIGLNHILFSPVGTDAFTFNEAGIPASGVLTGQDCCKLQSDVDLFGGSPGNFEGNVPGTDGGCVDNPFRWCDNLSNNDPKVLTFMSKGFPTWWSRWPSTRRCWARAAHRFTSPRCRHGRTPDNAAQRAEHMLIRTPQR